MPPDLRLNSRRDPVETGLRSEAYPSARATAERWALGRGPRTNSPSLLVFALARTSQRDFLHLSAETTAPGRGAPLESRTMPRMDSPAGPGGGAAGSGGFSAGSAGGAASMRRGSYSAVTPPPPPPAPARAAAGAGLRLHAAEGGGEGLADDGADALGSEAEGEDAEEARHRDDGEPGAPDVVETAACHAGSAASPGSSGSVTDGGAEGEGGVGGREWIPGGEGGGSGGSRKIGRIGGRLLAGELPGGGGSVGGAPAPLRQLRCGNHFRTDHSGAPRGCTATPWGGRGRASSYRGPSASRAGGGGGARGGPPPPPPPPPPPRPPPDLLPDALPNLLPGSLHSPHRRLLPPFGGLGGGSNGLSRQWKAVIVFTGTTVDDLVDPPGLGQPRCDSRACWPDPSRAVVREASGSRSSGPPAPVATWAYHRLPGQDLHLLVIDPVHGGPGRLRDYGPSHQRETSILFTWHTPTQRTSRPSSHEPPASNRPVLSYNFS